MNPEERTEMQTAYEVTTVRRRADGRVVFYTAEYPEQTRDAAVRRAERSTAGEYADARRIR